jgi:hypothetical protein
VDPKGTVVVQPTYDYAWDFHDGRAKVRLSDGSIRYVNPAGEVFER